MRDGEGQPLRSAAAVASGTRLDIEFADGRVSAIADGEGKPTSAPAAPAPRAKPKARGGSEGGGQGAGGQGSLFG